MTAALVVIGVGGGIVIGIFLAVTSILWEGHDHR